MWLKETYSGKLLQETLGNQTRRNSIASGETEGNKFCLTATVRGWKSLLKGNKEKEEKKNNPFKHCMAQSCISSSESFLRKANGM